MVAKMIAAQWFIGHRVTQSRRDMFGDMSLSIEVQYAEHGLVRVFFPKPAICNLLSDAQKAITLERIDYTVDEAQVCVYVCVLWMLYTYIFI
jgi:hypothetical protein